MATSTTSNQAVLTTTILREGRVTIRYGEASAPIPFSAVLMMTLWWVTMQTVPKLGMVRITSMEAQETTRFSEVPATTH
ncbi:hypothetical protein D3C87_1777150 [compost metagenome]